MNPGGTLSTLAAFQAAAYRGDEETVMSSDHVEGTLKSGVGHIQDAAGGVFGDGDLKAEGKLNEAVGFVQDKVGDIKDLTAKQFGSAQDRAEDFLTRVTSSYGDVETLVSKNPLIAVGIAATIGIGVGLALRGRPNSYR